MNKYKFLLFILATILSFKLFSINLCLPNAVLKNTILVILYIILILVGLYDLGKDVVDEEDS
jgi:hypothetical protein